MKRVLVACEESQEVTKRLRHRGIEAYSCDLQPTSGWHPEWHIQADALEIVKMEWDAVIAFPPCTHLAVSGASWFAEKIRDGRQQMGIGFFLAFTALDHIKHVAIENPVGIMSNLYRKPDQIINPWQFGDPYEKKTCLWLKNLPLLEPTNIVEPKAREYAKNGLGNNMQAWYSKTRDLPPALRSKERSKTFPGIADAMADVWGGGNRKRLHRPARKAIRAMNQLAINLFDDEKHPTWDDVQKGKARVVTRIEPCDALENGCMFYHGHCTHVKGAYAYPKRQSDGTCSKHYLEWI